MPKYAFVFPGQGAQKVGMAQDFYENIPAAKLLIDQASDIIPNLKTVMFDGPEETLRLTQYTQPAIFVASLAAWVAFQSYIDLTPNVLAGHSLGEFTALVASEALDLDTAIKLVYRRGELMGQAPAGKMAAIIGLPQFELEALVKTCQTWGVLRIANYNTEEQFVVSGASEAVERVCQMAIEKIGPRRVIMLPVGGAFHSELMDVPNSQFLPDTLSATFSTPIYPIITNIDGQLTQDAFELRQKLSEQMVSSVQWLQTMNTAIDYDVDTVIEFGPGRVLTGLFKKTSPTLNLLNVNDMASLEATCEVLASQLKETVTS